MSVTNSSVTNSSATKRALQLIELNDCVDVGLLSDELNESIFEVEALLEDLTAKGFLEECFFDDFRITAKGIRVASR